MDERVTLIRRDLPIEQGAVLRFEFTVNYELPIDEDLLNGETGLSLDEIEEWLAGDGQYSDRLFKALSGNYDRTIVEHDVTLAGGRTEELRFERPWEAKERLAPSHDWSRSRVWLDEVPTSAGALDLAQRALRLGEAAKVDPYPTAAEVMEREG